MQLLCSIIFVILVSLSSMSTFSITKICREPRQHKNIVESDAKFTLDCFQDVPMDFLLPFFNDSNVVSRV